MADARHAYICIKDGEVVEAVAEGVPGQTAKIVAGWLEEGCIVERVATARVRELLFGPWPPAQAREVEHD